MNLRTLRKLLLLLKNLEDSIKQYQTARKLFVQSPHSVIYHKELSRYWSQYLDSRIEFDFCLGQAHALGHVSCDLYNQLKFSYPLSS